MRRIVETHSCASLACVSTCVSTVRLCICHNTMVYLLELGLGMTTFQYILTIKIQGDSSFHFAP